MDMQMEQVKVILTKIERLDDRIRSLEKYMWIAFGALGLLQFVLPFAFKFFGVEK